MESMSLVGGLTILCVILATMLYRATDARTRAEVELVTQNKAKAVLQARLDALEVFNRRAASRADECEVEVKRTREKYEAREADFLRQIQSLCERIATLRQGKLTEGGEATFTPMVPDKPYSDDLVTFLSRLDTEEARNLVEEKIEELRGNGIEDEQIYKIISE